MLAVQGHSKLEPKMAAPEAEEATAGKGTLGRKPNGPASQR